VPEYIGIKCRVTSIAESLAPLIDDGEARFKMLEEYRLIRNALGAQLPVGPTERTAQIVEEMLQEANGSAVAQRAVA
jgi:lipid A disaccharide synthetase